MELNLSSEERKKGRQIKLLQRKLTVQIISLQAKMTWDFECDLYRFVHGHN